MDYPESLQIRQLVLFRSAHRPRRYYDSHRSAGNVRGRDSADEPLQG